MRHPVEPVVAKVHSDEAEPPRPGRVPGELEHVEVLVDVHVALQGDRLDKHPGEDVCVVR